MKRRATGKRPKSKKPAPREVNIYKATIQINKQGLGIITCCSPSLEDNKDFDGYLLAGNIIGVKTIPKEAGSYKCDIVVKYTPIELKGCARKKFYKDSWLENVERISNLEIINPLD